LPPGGSLQVSAGARDIALFRIGDELFAIGNVCPHAGGSLAEGSLEDHGVVCPLHAWKFDVRSGECAGMKGVSVQTYSVRVGEQDKIEVRLP